MPERTLPSASLQTDAKTEYDGIGELWAVEKCLPGYNRAIVRGLAAHLPRDGDILDFGAGIGTLAGLWQAETGRRPDCLEIDAALRDVIAGRGFSAFASIEALGAAGRRYDGVYSSNVMEHIEDDVAALGALRSVLKDGGTVAIYVPAFMCLYSAMDEAVGHYRRYSRAELLEKLARAGFAPVSCRYADSIGFTASLALRLKRPGSGTVAVPGERSLKLYDDLIFPLSRTLVRLGGSRLFGKNLLAVARKV